MSENDPSSRAPTPVLREIFATQQVYDARGNAVKLDSNISVEECALLHAAVSELRPQLSVEVGFANGVSTLAILDALQGAGVGHHHVIDPFQRNYDYRGRAMVERAGLAGRFTFHERFADEVVPTLPPVQFAFIDSSHLFDQTVAEFVMVDRKLAVGGVVGFHDMWMPSQQAFIRYVLANRAYAPWQPASAARQTGAGMPPRARWLRKLLGKLPRARRVFAEDFLRPWAEFDLGNLVLLRKTAEDTRDWRFHARF